MGKAHLRTLKPGTTYSESALQIQCIAHFRTFYPKICNLLVYNDNNARNAIAGHRKKLLGTVAGWPDLSLYVPAWAFHGLLIEMKAAKQKASPLQRQIHEVLRAQGYRVEVVDSFNGFRALLEDYLGKKS